LTQRFKPMASNIIKASFQNALLFHKEQKLRLRFQEYAPADVVEELLNDEL
jgi:hypothetical protein